ncbi:hypothetical protein L1887_52136 [Cichorium endivia]|nr:hypothetical protein L1887_52136 [Cichorium endivia]
MIHDNSTDRTALVPATHHSIFCPINFRWCAPVYLVPSVGDALLALIAGSCLRRCYFEEIRVLKASLRSVCDALRCSGPHARYTDVFNEYIALADRPGKSLKFHRDGDRSLQLLVFNEEFLVSASHQLAFDYVPAHLYTTSPSLLPIEWSGEVLGSRRRGRVRRRRRRENSTEPYHLEEGEVVTRFP